MKSFLSVLLIVISSIMAHGQDRLYITANGQTVVAALESNESAEQFKALLPLTIRMSDYGGWEKVGDLPHTIVRADRQLTARPGDIMLYQGRSVVIFYGDNSWAYTPLGKIVNTSASAVKELLSGSSLDVTFSLSPSSGIDAPTLDAEHHSGIYDAEGKEYHSSANLPSGIYIINGKKTLIK